MKTISIKRLVVWAFALACGVIQSVADEPTFKPDQLYTIRNKVTQKSMCIGEPNSGEIQLCEGFGGAKFEKIETGKWQILSPLEGALTYELFYDPLHVIEESGFTMDIELKGDYYVISFVSSDATVFYFGAESNGSGIIPYSDSDISNKNNDPDIVLWEIIPLPDGAIIDVPSMEVEMPNRTYKVNDWPFNYYASSIELSDAMGFACAHDVITNNLTFTRTLKPNWQGLCAPFKLDKADWEQFGTLYKLDKLVEESDGTLSLSLAEVDEFVPNTPYLIYVTKEGTINTKKDIECVVSPSIGLQPAVVETDNVKCELSCVYDFTEVPMSDKSDAIKTYALSKGAFKRPSESGVKVSPYRVMLTVTSKGSAPERIAVKTDDGTTVIDVIETESETQQWYDLNGRPATRGLLISPAGKVLKH